MVGGIRTLGPFPIYIKLVGEIKIKSYIINNEKRTEYSHMDISSTNGVQYLCK